MIPFVILAIETDDDRIYMTRLYQEHNTLMYKIAWEYVSQQTDADDIVSEICVALINKISIVRTFSPLVLRSYVATTAKNTAIDYIRKSKRYSKRFTSADDEILSQVMVDNSIEKQIVLFEEVEQVLDALQRLSDRDRDVLRMKFFQGMSDSEIAASIQISEVSVRKVVERSRKHLKKWIYQGATE